jgi:hypothetical protein
MRSRCRRRGVGHEGDGLPVCWQFLMMYLNSIIVAIFCSGEKALVDFALAAVATS